MNTIFRKSHKPLTISIVFWLFILFASAQVQSQELDFDPNVGGYYNSSNVLSMAVQDDGKVFITGNFFSVGNVSLRHIARLEANGEVDLSFNSELRLNGNAMAIQSDGKLIVAGRFETAGASPNAFVRNKIARLNTDGSVDPDFNPNSNGDINTVLIQDDGKILIGGVFTTIGGVARSRLARLNADGSVDTGFADLAINSGVNAVVLQDDGKIVIGGNFISVGGEVRNKVARLNADGSLDTSFIDPQINGQALALAVQDDSGIIVGGQFSAIGQFVRSGIARLEADGNLDTGFIQSFPSREVRDIKLQTDGKILIGGNFSKLGNREVGFLARLLENGRVDVSFNPAVERSNGGSVRTILVQDDDKILVGGFFNKVGSLDRNNMARINMDGSVEGIIDAMCIPIKAVNGAVAVVCL